VTQIVLRPPFQRPRLRAWLFAAEVAALTSQFPVTACSSGANADRADATPSAAGAGAGGTRASAGSGGQKGGTSAATGGGAGGAAAAGRSSGTGDTGHSGGSSGDAGHAGSPGSGTVQGALGSRMFDSVSNSWLIGMPDDPQRTRVIYVFDKPVACAEIAMAGWDKTVTDATQALEIKLIGTMAGTYPVVTSGQPATGQADVNYSLTSRTVTPMEDLAKGGTVRLDSITDRVSARGSFDLTFPSGSVSGTFEATFCMSGHEP